MVAWSSACGLSSTCSILCIGCCFSTFFCQRSRKRTGFDWRELDMLEETDVIIENIRNAICTVTGYIPPRRPYPEDEMDPVQ
jgi:hypothetical protein